MRFTLRFTLKRSITAIILLIFTVTCILLIIDYKNQSKKGISGLFSKESVNIPDELKNFHVEESPSHEYDDLALCIKSGADVFYDRIPGLLKSYPKYVKNKIIVGEKPGYRVGNYVMHDVCTPTYGEIKETYWSQFKDEKKEEENNKKDHTEDKDDLTKGRKQEFNKLGWQLDVYKNIPAFKLLYDTYPNAKWYMMVDDDTYVFLSNLKKRLSYYNPDDKLYLGASWPIPTGCFPSWSMARFAHGGAGIILSRGAMLAFIEKYDYCVKSFDDCYAGDVRLALCLNTVGIRINRLNHTNISWRGHSDQAPNLEYSWLEPCDLPLTFHHLYSKQQKLLFEIQRYNNRDSFQLLNDNEDGNFHGLISYSDVFNALDLELKVTPPEKATYRLGSDYKRISYTRTINETEVLEENVINCQHLCIKDMPKCKSWQYSNFMCHLKSGIPGAIEGTPNSYTGITGVPIYCDKELILH